MLDLLLGLTLWQLTVAVLGIAFGVGLGLSVGIRKLFRLNPTGQQADLAIDLMQVTSTYIGILLAFAGVLAWQDYKDADTAVEREAGVASFIYRDLAAYGPQMAAAREDLKSYVDSVIVNEWPLLREGKRSAVTEDKLLKLFDDFAAVTPGDERQATIYREAFTQLNEMVALRRDRMAASRAEIPPVLSDRRTCGFDTDDRLCFCVRRLAIRLTDDFRHIANDRPALPVPAQCGLSIPELRGREQ